VLAGSRGGVDPVAEYAGVSQKGLIVLGGQTLLTRVLTALDQAGAERIAVSTNDAALQAALAGETTRAALSRLPSAAGPSQSVHEGAEAMGTPLLVTTVDHALLQPEWVTDFMADTPADADIAILLGEEALVQAAAPDHQAHLSGVPRRPLFGLQPVLSEDPGVAEGHRPVAHGREASQEAVEDRGPVRTGHAGALPAGPDDPGRDGGADRPPGGGQGGGRPGAARLGGGGRRQAGRPGPGAVPGRGLDPRAERRRH
jgi:hypothetical protein